MKSQKLNTEKNLIFPIFVTTAMFCTYYEGLHLAM